MKKILTFVLFILTPIYTSSVFAEAIPIPEPPDLKVNAYFLQEYHTKKIIAEKNADSPVEPASITKLMTAYVVFSELKNQHIKIDDEVTVSKKAWKTHGSRMFIEVGSTVTIKELIQGMIIQSGNDASVALAEHIAGSEQSFAQLMNTYAKKLGLKNSHFANSTGLPHDNHYTSARDIAIITNALISGFPQYYPWYSKKSFTYNNIKQFNRNKLLWRDPSVDGLKTGWTKSAGYCLVASAQRQDMRLVSVVLGSGTKYSRIKESQTLLNYGFRFYETHKLYRKHQVLAKVRVWQGAKSKLELGSKDDIYVTIPSRQYGKLKAYMEVDTGILAAVNQGDVYGEIKVEFNDKLIATMPLIALESVAEGNLWQRLLDQIRMKFF